MIKQGDFTALAKSYINRPGYSLALLKQLASHVGYPREPFQIADVGAGTGKLTENLLDLGFNVVCVEPNDAMRAEGERLTGHRGVTWHKGSGEATGLPDESADWVFMASSFHWTDPEKSLPEFHRILRPGGHFTAVWNPRDLSRSPLQERIDSRIREMVPTLKRKSSGAARYTKDLEEVMVSTGHFEQVHFVEAPFDEMMSKERYMGAWRSVNDIQAQAGPEGFEKVMAMIEGEIADLDEVAMPYLMRSWTAKVIK